MNQNNQADFYYCIKLIGWYFEWEVVEEMSLIVKKNNVIIPEYLNVSFLLFVY